MLLKINDTPNDLRFSLLPFMHSVSSAMRAWERSGHPGLASTFGQSPCLSIAQTLWINRKGAAQGRPFFLMAG